MRGYSFRPGVKEPERQAFRELYKRLAGNGFRPRRLKKESFPFAGMLGRLVESEAEQAMPAKEWHWVCGECFITYSPAFAAETPAIPAPLL